MNNWDFFKQEGVRIPLDGQKSLFLHEDHYIWIVEQGKAAVFLSTMDEELQTGTKTFLFEACPGDWLFGITPEGTPHKKGLLVSGLLGSSLLRFDIRQLTGLLMDSEEADEEAHKKFQGTAHEELQGLALSEQRGADKEISEMINKAIGQWLHSLAQISGREDISQKAKTAFDLGSSQDEVASTAEGFISVYEYLIKDSLRAGYHSQVVQAASNLWDKKRESEEKRLEEKSKSDRRLMDTAISKLAAITEKVETKALTDQTGDVLLDACRLVGQTMQMKIVAPPEVLGSRRELHLDDIARASRVRVREVALHGDWYTKDSGPLLGYMKKDHRPIALIPSAPTKYFLHDYTQGVTRTVDRDTAQEIDAFGFVFYRPFAEKKITARDLLNLGWENSWRRDFLMIFLMGILGGILGTAIPLATGIIFNTIIPEGERGHLVQIAFFLGASALATMIFQFVRSMATLRIEGKMEGAIQAAIWDRLLSLPVPFFKQFPAGELAMRAMGISQIRKILSGVTLNTVLSSIFSVFTLVLMFYYDRKLAGVATILVAVALLIMFFLGYRQVGYERKILDISNRISGMMLQLIGGITKFRVAGAEVRAFYRWAERFSEQRQFVYKRRILGNWLTTFHDVFPLLASMIIFYALTAGHSQLSPGEFIGFNAAFISFTLSMSSLAESIIGSYIVIPLYQRAKPILDTLPEYDETKITPVPLRGSIEMDHISFRYKEDGPLVLKDISLQIKEGDYVALVGTSGCGKSTLLRILLGFEKPETGNIYYDGQDLEKVDIRSIRKQLGVVLQNGQLMSGNIFTNIVGANPYLTIDDAWAAARMAGIEEDIQAMPMGMHTMISEGASTISGGQKQRLMIARAIVNQPKILFFDEATSALDNRTQAIVSQSLDRMKVTRIVIAHRLSTIINCNMIIVMDQGRIVESGTYDELMSNSGVFANLVHRQLA
ncbi:NHLM bacteriocin system ABC transporter, ATP-binding protein [Desulfitobacterium dichloroeliminans LMG P-21439]|uniref:NHLM bacteriocin system ABC transporter, ATP-binding protein n=1 Tax=Desulfitobacterium dichloroeliminans (strain LMG P-21439 / DCA1) TaxID=871963 RepID=L0FAS9_DESDL|nr:NHLP bacteriocin export ABC transporter permease/ATPase subunit [Desulfitobacterium dichloroeliminans]AGA70028.1 NHLM bacteriocin system ABC transporter, ATP-binding protein [Desulfitobacterium dichloroeliminans LMG P-21439]